MIDTKAKHVKTYRVGLKTCRCVQKWVRECIGTCVLLVGGRERVVGLGDAYRGSRTCRGLEMSRVVVRS
jgi:hypothetical protein